MGCTQLKDRIRRHLSDVLLSESRIVSAVSKHCADTHNGSSASLHIQGIERVTLPIRGGDRRKQNLNRDFTLNTRIPKGLNYRQDLIVCY